MTLILPQLDISSGDVSDFERKRLEELYSMDVLDASSDERLGNYTDLAATVIDAPMASIVLVDENRLVHKAVRGRSVSDVARDTSFAVHTMRQEELLLVEDASADPRFAAHPLVCREPYVRSYAGGVIRSPGRRPLGALCVMDTEPRRFSRQQQKFLIKLTRILEQELGNRADVADLRRRLREHVLLDNATRLPTEALFTARLAQELDDAPTSTIMLALIRLERFESIHSAVGRPGAAHLLRTAVARLEEALEQDCLMGQIREDVIAIAVVLADAASAEAEAQRMLGSFTEPFHLGEHTLAQSVSIGLAIYPAHGRDSQTLLKRARTTLNTMPQAEISSFRQYDRRLSDEAARHFEIGTALRGAIARNELSLAYQPRIHIQTGMLVGAEALLRWATPTLGEIRPAEFIPIAESSGLIVQLGDWVLATACEQIATWRKRGRDCGEIGVNVSSIQLKEPSFCDRIRKLLDEHEIHGSNLNLEVTEGTLIENIGDAIRVMSELRELGISFSIDDFGKGYSSLTYLVHMPVQVLKIDRTFVDRIPREEMSVTITRSIIAMAHGLGLQVVAEGVETGEQLELLRAEGCDQAQGFLISPPLDVHEFAAGFL